MVLLQEDDIVREHDICYLSHVPFFPEHRYSHVEQLELVVVYSTQRLCHYIFLRKNKIVFNINKFQYVLSRGVIEGKFNKWIFVLQKYDIQFMSKKSRKPFVFIKLFFNLPGEVVLDYDEEWFLDKQFFLISSKYPSYWDILVYIPTLKFPQSFSWGDYQLKHDISKYYLLISDVFYCYRFESKFS